MDQAVYLYQRMFQLITETIEPLIGIVVVDTCIVVLGIVVVVDTCIVVLGIAVVVDTCIVVLGIVVVVDTCIVVY